MTQVVTQQTGASSLTGLLLPLSDRALLVPNVALAELIPYRAPQASPGLPAWLLGQIAWRDLRLPLLSSRRPPAARYGSVPAPGWRYSTPWAGAPM